MSIAENINVTKKSFEESFKEEKYYNRQTKDDKHLKLILNMTELDKNDLILDLGTGSGYLAFAIAAKNPHNQVIGLDIVEETLKDNEEKAKEQNINNIQFINYDGIRFPFEDESIDVIYTRYALHHFPDIISTFNEIKRVLKPGGKVIISDPTPNENDKDGFVDEYMRIKPDGHVKFYNKKDYEKLVEINKLQIKTHIVTEIRFPRKKSKEYIGVLEKYDKNIVNGYKIEVKNDEIFITEKVLNIVMEKEK